MCSRLNNTDSDNGVPAHSARNPTGYPPTPQASTLLSHNDGPTPPVTIPWDAFPHIIDQVLADLDLETLCTFRATSRYFRNRIEADLGTIVITESAIASLPTLWRKRSADDEDESLRYKLSLHTRAGQHLCSFTTAMVLQRRAWKYKTRRPAYSPRAVGYIAPSECKELKPLARSTYPLTIRVVGDCVRRHRLLLGILDVLRLRPNVSLQFLPDAQGDASQLAWPSPWEVVLLHNDQVNWWSGAYLYDAPRVVYQFDGTEGEVVVGPRIHGGERLSEVAFDFTRWKQMDAEPSAPGSHDGYPTRATQLAARAASLLSPGRTIVFRGLDQVQLPWLDAGADAASTPKDLLLGQAIMLAPVPPPIVAATCDHALQLNLPPPPPVEQSLPKRTIKLFSLTLALPETSLYALVKLHSEPRSKGGRPRRSDAALFKAGAWTRIMPRLLRITGAPSE